MNKFLTKIHSQIISLETILIPNYFLIRTNPEFLGIKNLMIFASKKIKKNETILDAGAGETPYKHYFSHTKYESTDIKDPSENKKHTFNCSLDDIPKPDRFYDDIICTQVLEHVEYPQKVVNELYRVLKPGGKLFLTAPQGWGLHEAPYNFYNFTTFGLKSLFTQAGFKIIFIKPTGGIFWFIGALMRTLPSHIYYQFLFPKNKKKYYLKLILALLLFPLFILFKLLFSLILPLIFYYLDFLDNDKIFTLGHTCYCIKKQTK